MRSAGRTTIVLVYPGRPGDGREQIVPLSVMSLVAPLRGAGFNPVIYDERVDGDFGRVLESVRDDLLFVGLSTLTGNTITYGLAIARRVREAKPDVPVVWGGVHPTLVPDETLANPYVDLVARGEGEETVVELARALRDGTDLANVAGVSFKTGGEIRHTPSRTYSDFDSLAPVDYELLDAAKYTVEKYLHYQSSRGCPFRCTFCDVRVFHGKRQRFKSVETVLADLDRIVARFHPATIEFVDDNFLSNLQRAEEIMHGIIDRGLDFKWLCTCRADFFRRMSDDFLALMRWSGCREVYVGIESGSQAVLDAMHKDITIGQVREAATRLLAAGIKMSCNFVAGVPDETLDDFAKTIEMYKWLADLSGDDPARINIGGILLYAPYPGTEEYEKVVSLGYRPPDSFEAWGRFMLNDPSNLTWHSPKHVAYISTVAQVTRGGTQAPSVRTIAGSLARGRVKLFTYYVLKRLAHWRWKHQLFAAPLDVRLLDRMRKWIWGYG